MARTNGLTTGETIYCVAVILCTGFLLVSLAGFHFVIIPTTDDPGIFYFIAAVLWLYVFTLAVTTSLNLTYGKLLLIPTILQCVVLGLAIYFLPIAIWGAVMLYRSKRWEQS
jgi:hypothetical protein